MPSIIPSYIYTIFASLIVGTLIIGMCALATSNIRQEAEKQQLSNIEEYVAAKSVELASNALANNLTSTVSLDLPNLIGNKIYWIRIANEIPLEAFASGTHISSSRPASLHCYTDNQSIHLEIQGDN
jgi:hypothetical protein